jgi:DNA-binding NarL/FixJ family response regulator
VAQPYRLDDSTECVLAFEALEGALRGLKEEVVRTARRCQEVRRAYERLLEAAASDEELPRVGPESILHRLTPRERLVAALAANGRTNAQVAAELHVSLHTVKSQMRSVLRKMEIESRWQIPSWSESGNIFQRNPLSARSALRGG